MSEYSGGQLKRHGNGPAVHVFNLRSQARADHSRGAPSTELSLRRHTSANAVRSIAAISPGFGQTNPGNEN